MTSPLSETAAKTLAMLLDPRHLTAEAIATARAEFGDGDNRHLVLDHVLAPHLLPLLRQVADGAGAFEDNLKLASDYDTKTAGVPRGRVDAATFAAAPHGDRFIKQRRLTGPAPGQEDSAAIKAEGFARTMLGSEPLHRWLGALTGIAPERTGGINFKLHGPGHFLTRHSDARAGRTLCAVIYLHAYWEAAYAGRFVLHRLDGTDRVIDPLPNRMILFEANDQNHHSIEPLGAVPNGWWRVNYSVWFN